MTDNKQPPENFELRARPKPVTRINRKVLLGGAAITLALIGGAFLIALDPPNWRTDTERKELYQTRHKAPPDGLEKLPETYDRIPKLGPPNAGDIGKTITRVERDLGIKPLPGRQLPSYRPDPEEEFRRAERIRLARLAAQSAGSDLFFSQRKQTSDLGNNRKAEPASTARPSVSPQSALSTLPQANRPTDQYQQKAKLAFLEDGPDDDIYNEHATQHPASPYQLMAGTIIAASLATGLNSDLPGTVIAQVTEHVYDTVSGQYLLIPQGSRLIGKYDSQVSFGQNRALVVWQRIIRPDGSSIVIENLPGTDEAGNAGLTDRVNHHAGALLKGIALSSVLGVGTELTLGDNESDLVEAIRESAQQSTNRAGQSLVQRSLDIQPTITVRPGWPLRIIVHKDIVLPPMKGNQ
ncbi:TrbI/VirB10 family protein [Hoeflea poritis]|uniref:Conjugal transfer protein TraI n=1 Tax=Hoeflea poritis TaxID=2993659 RepID=A0ABT4VV42_9HYPH|nr:TrbI/VirB10 family protein [Hoeflea poritis]MDA4848586.1 conjugal transfer protein TraI [Hoeflea poritis]